MIILQVMSGLCVYVYILFCLPPLGAGTQHDEMWPVTGQHCAQKTRDLRVN